MSTIRRYAWAWWWGLAVVLATPALASWNITATEAIWSGTGDLALVQEARDAILWERGQRALLGAVMTAALPNLSVTDNGDGTGTVRIVMTRTAGEAWIADYAVTGCGTGLTNAQILACVDAAIKADIRAVIQRYRASQVAEVTPPPELEN